MPTSPDSSLARYHRQMLLPSFGEAGQQRLRDATALIVGCGALGTFLCDALARAGVGRLVIVDRDFIELNNLQRQVLFDEDDVEAAIPKAEAARRKLTRINSQVKVRAVVDDLNHTNVEKLALGSGGAGGSGGSGGAGANSPRADVIVDGLDNFETRFLLNDCAVKHGIPYVYGGAVGTVGMTYTILPHSDGGGADAPPWEAAGRATPCLRCIFEQAPPPGMNPTCDTAGVLGPLVSIVAGFEAAEALKILTGNWQAVNRSMQHIDIWDNSFHQFDVGPIHESGKCTCCKQRRFEYLEGKFSAGATTLCGRDAVQLTRKADDGSLDFDQLARRLEAHGKIKSNPFMLRVQLQDGGKPYELTVFADGRAIVKGTSEASTAKSIYARYVGA